MPIALAILCLIFQPAADDDPAMVLKTARDAYNGEIEGATRFLEDTMRRWKDNTGDRDRERIIQAQKALFETDGKLPTSPLLSREVSDYKLKVRMAEDKFRKALNTAKNGFMDAKRLDEAEAAEAELKEFLASRMADRKEGQSEVPGGVSLRGTCWKGTKEEKPGSIHHVTLWVTNAQGQGFDGFFEFTEEGDGRIFKVIGTFEGDKISFGTVLRTNEKFQQSFEGERKDGLMTLKFSGTNPGGHKGIGTAHLELEPR